MKCSKCGTENAEEFKFCGTCGTPLFRPDSAVNAIPTKQIQRTVPAPRKALSGRMQAWITIGVLSLLALCLCSIGTLITGTPQSTIPSAQLPTFKVIGRDITALSLLVPQNTTGEQLAQLISAFRQARKENSLGRMGIPATTLGGKSGDYAIIIIFVFTEPEWASESTLKQGMRSSYGSPFYDEFGKHVKAYYYFDVASGTEEGSVGYAEDGKVYSSAYRKLF